LVNINVNIKL